MQDSNLICYSGATSKFEIANLFSLDKSIQSQIKRLFNYKEWSSDVIQDVCIIILEYKKEEELIKICHQNKFNFWLFAILKKQKYNKKSETNNKYISNHQLIEENVQQNENSYTYKENDEHRKYIIFLIKKEIEQIRDQYWYRAKVFEEYAEKKQEYKEQGKQLTLEQFGKEININKDSLWQIIKKVKLQLKERLKDEL